MDWFRKMMNSLDLRNYLRSWYDMIEEDDEDDNLGIMIYLMLLSCK